MDNNDDDSHLLFPLSSYVDAQTEFIDSILPELSSCQRTINLNSVKQFEELLFHLEITFKTNKEYLLESEKLIYSHIKVPSVDVLRIILTLASRCPSRNYSRNSTSVGSLITLNETNQGLNEDYYRFVSKSSLKDRCVWILQQYLSLLFTSHKINNFVLKLLYTRLVKLLKDFIVEPSKHHGIATFEDLSLVRSAGDQKLSQRRNDLPKFEKSPKKGHTISLSSVPSTQEDIKQSNDDIDVISDSEDEIPLLCSKWTSKNMEDEVNKYQQYNLSPVKKSTTTFSANEYNQTSGLEDSKSLFNGVPHLTSTLKEPIDKEESFIYKQRRALDDDPHYRINPKKRKFLEKWQEMHPLDRIKVFDDGILCKKLNPNINCNFNLWKLIDWTFYCANKSSKYQCYLPNSSETSYHIIYTTYKDLLNIVIDLISYNFIHELSNSPQLKLKSENFDPIKEYFKFSRSEKDSLIQDLENSNEFLLLVLLKQLNALQIDMYDRAVEYIFVGLIRKISDSPQPCYERDKLQIKHDSLIKHKYSKTYKIDFNDNMDSLQVRFKLLSVIYYASLLYSDGSLVNGRFDKSHTFLCPEKLLREICSRLLLIDFKYFKEFYLLSLGDNSLILKEYKSKMMAELSKTLLLDISKLIDVDKFIYNKQLEINKSPKFIYDLLESINDEEIYLQLIEDETYSSFDDFEQIWLKLNFLIEWLLNVSLTEFESLLNDNAGLSSMLKHIHQELKKADILRIDMFNSFVAEHSKPNDKFNFILDEPQVDLICNSDQKWLNFEDLFITKFFSYIESSQ